MCHHILLAWEGHVSGSSSSLGQSCSAASLGPSGCNPQLCSLPLPVPAAFTFSLMHPFLTREKITPEIHQPTWPAKDKDRSLAQSSGTSSTSGNPQSLRGCPCPLTHPFTGACSRTEECSASHGPHQCPPSLCDPLVGRVPPADPGAPGHHCARALFPLRPGCGPLGEQTLVTDFTWALICWKMGLLWPQVVLLWLESGCLSLDSSEQVEGGVYRSFSSPQPGKCPHCPWGGLSRPVLAKVLRALVRKRLSEYKVLLTMMFCSSRKELLSYKSPVLVHRGPDSR